MADVKNSNPEGQKVDEEMVEICKSLLTLINDKTKIKALNRLIERRIKKHQEILETPGYTETIYSYHRGSLNEMRVFEKLDNLVKGVIDG